MGMIDNEEMKTKNRLNSCYGMMVEQFIKNESKAGKRYYRIHGSFDILIDTDPMADQEQTRTDHGNT